MTFSGYFPDTIDILFGYCWFCCGSNNVATVSLPFSLSLIHYLCFTLMNSWCVAGIVECATKGSQEGSQSLIRHMRNKAKRSDCHITHALALPCLLPPATCSLPLATCHSPLSGGGVWQLATGALQRFVYISISHEFQMQFVAANGRQATVVGQQQQHAVGPIRPSCRWPLPAVAVAVAVGQKALASNWN